MILVRKERKKSGRERGNTQVQRKGKIKQSKCYLFPPKVCVRNHFVMYFGRKVKVLFNGFEYIPLLDVC